MESVRLSTLDLTLVIVYLVAVTAFGLWASRGIRSSKDFFLAGRSLPWWAAGMSMVVSDIGAKDMIGLAGDAYRFGIVMMNFDFVGCTLPLLVAAFLFIPFFWSSEVYTIPEYLGPSLQHGGAHVLRRHLVVLHGRNHRDDSRQRGPRCSRGSWGGLFGFRLG